MKKICLLIALVSAIIVNAQNNDLRLWYKKSAQNWNEALPVGNGRLGAMVFGNTHAENIQLNEESLWAGSKINNNNPGARTHLKEIQEAIFAGDFQKGLTLSNQYLVGTPPRVRSYQPLGNLFIHYRTDAEPQAYSRSLNLHTGIVESSWRTKDNSFKQEVFASAPQDIIFVRISAVKSFDADLVLSRIFSTENENRVRRKKAVFPETVSENQYRQVNGLAYYTGQIIDAESNGDGPAGKHMRYAAAMKILSADGTVMPIVTDSSSGYSVKAVKTIVVLITGATNYHFEKMDLDSTIDALSVCKSIIGKAMVYSAATLQKIQEQDHRNLFDRVSFSLGEDSLQSLSTAERLERIRDGKTDNHLAVLYYQMGRYLLMGSSRKPGRLPANLQGIWNDLYFAPWNSDFHTNINLQMNYWSAESGNLSETSVVLSKFIQALMVPGKVTAREMYGAKGWTIHHLTDVFGRTGVADGVWGITPMDGPWMTFPVYEHFEYTQDTAFLRKIAYPMIRGSVQFVLDFLVRSPQGYLVTNPSHSPENTFYVPNTNHQQKSQLTYAPTVDIHIIHELFNHFLQAAKILKTDPDLVKQVLSVQTQLPPLKVAPNGTLEEWIENYDEVDPGHRHMSHLLGLYPLHLITEKDTVFYQAAQKTLARRLANGGGHVGWSKAWIVGLYARLHNGEKAWENLNDLLQKSTMPNLFDNYPPFQIDANFGGASAILEMLLQSDGREISLLPALPGDWKNGLIKGVRAKGACTVNMEWKEGSLYRITLVSDKGGNFTIRYHNQSKQLLLKVGSSITLNGSLQSM